MKMRVALFLVPLMLFVGLLIFLGVGLKRDPKLVPSPLIGKSVPAFSLPQLGAPDQWVSHAVFKGQVSLLNVWASWCTACLEEHPFLMRLAQEKKVAIFGLNSRDPRENALRWLGRHGNPYVMTAHDLSGRVGIDFGVYGAPETFLIDRNGTIVYKQIGAVTPEVWQEILLPLIAQLEQAGK